MKLLRAAACIALIGVCRFASAGPMTTVAVDLVPQGLERPIKGSITFRPAMGPAAPVVLTCCSQAMTVALPPGTAWEVIPKLEGAWAARRVVVIPAAPLRISLPAFPAATLMGRFEKPAGSQLPQGFTISMVDVMALAHGSPSEEEIDCPIAIDGRWSCEVPSGTRDLLLRVGGFVPLQKWGLSTGMNEKRDLGVLQLRRGAVVSGWVSLSEGKVTAGVGRAAIVPLAAAGSGVIGNRVTRTIADAPLEKNGYFQIAGVPLGRYALQVTYRGFAAQTVVPIQVYDDRETRLRQPIVLHRPISLTIAVQPPVDPRGDAWTVVVARASPFSGGYDTRPVFNGPSRDGAVLIRGQSAGRYMVDVYDSAENRFSHEEFPVIGDADAIHTIPIDTVAVRGTVTTGDDPIAATLWFGGKFGAQRVAMRSNSTGRFRGILPRAGKWRVSIVTDDNSTAESSVDVRPSNGEADVSLTVPSNELTGIVVNMNGDPVGRAHVALVAANGSSVIRKESGDDGLFRFRGVQPGDVLLSASVDTAGDSAESDAATVHVEEKGSSGPVQLVLVPGQRLTGTVRSPDGAIAGAYLNVLAMGTDQVGGATAVSDADGHYVLRVPGNAQRAMITVRAPGCALRVFDVPLPNHGAVLNVPEVGGEVDIAFGRKAPEPGSQMILTFQDDRPIVPNELFNWVKSHGLPYPADNGYQLPDMAPAHYTVCVIRPRAVRPRELTSDMSGANCADGFLAPFGKLTIQLPAAP